MITTKRKLLATLLTLGLVLMLAPLVLAATNFFQGFETDNSGWDVLGGQYNAIRVASGTNGVTSKTGSFHAEAGQFDLDIDGGSAFTRWGGYESVFPTGGYTTSVDIYLDVAGISANDTRFDWSSAINDSSGNHRRDFVFNAGGYTDAGNYFVVSASTNAGRGSSFPKNPGKDPFTITTSGWYTFRHRFYDNGGVLAVDLSIIDSTNTTIHTWTLSDPGDLIGGIGGHRYGWFASNEFTFLAFDNSELISAPPPCTTDCYVDAATGDDANGGASPGDPKKTIQAAVNQVDAGGTVHVAAGTYDEQVSLNKSITLLGAQAGIDPGCIGPVGAESIIQDPDGPVQITADNVVIEGFTIQGNTTFVFNSGIWSSAAVSGHQLRHNTVQNNIIGIYLNASGANQTVVEDNLIRNNTNPGPANGNGIYSDAGLKNTLIDSNCFQDNFNAAVLITAVPGPKINGDLGITHNQMTNNGIGVFLGSTNIATVADNTIEDSQSSDIAIAGDSKDITVDHNTVTNGVSRFLIAGAFFGFGNNEALQITNNTVNKDVGLLEFDRAMIDLQNVLGASNVTGNQLNLSGTPSGVTFAHGVEVQGGSTGSLAITNNQLDGGNWDVFDGSTDSTGLLLHDDLPQGIVDITGNSIHGFVRGAFNQADAVDMVENDIYDNDYGISLANALNNTMTGNFIHDNTVNGLTIADEASTSSIANNNQICRNTTFGASNLGTSLVNAENNWWGATDGPGPVGPGSGDKVSAHIDFDPFITANPSSGPCALPTGSLTLVKETTPAGVTGFQFTGELGDFTLDDGQNQLFSDLPIGTYDVFELTSSFPGSLWTLVSVTCQDQTGAKFSPPVVEDKLNGLIGATIPLAADQQLTCTFHNEQSNFEPGEESYQLYLPLLVK